MPAPRIPKRWWLLIATTLVFHFVPYVKTQDTSSNTSSTDMPFNLVAPTGEFYPDDTDVPADMTRPPFLTIPYRSTFQIAIYRLPGKTPETTSYYYTPSLIVIPSGTSQLYHNGTDRHTVQFTIQMWDANYEGFIKQTLATKIPDSTKGLLRIIPISDIRIDATERFPDCRIPTKWMAYVNQPAQIQPRFECTSLLGADTVMYAIQSDTKYFAASLEVIYSLQKQLEKIKKSLAIRPQRIQSTDMFQLLNQKYPDNDKIYMRYTDVLAFLKDVVSAVDEGDTNDNEFVAQSQTYKIQKSLGRKLGIRPISTIIFTTEEWNQVYWSDGWGQRPDLWADSINTISGKSADRIQVFLKAYSANPAIDPTDPQYGLSTSDVEEANNITGRIMLAKDTLQWNGTFWVPKPLTLSTVNLTALRSNQVLDDVEFWITVAKVNLTAKVNVIPDYEFSQALKEVRNQEDTFIPSGTIVSYYSSLYLPDGWLWCNGSVVDPVKYPRLSELLKPQITTPDLRGRFLVGTGSSYSQQIGEIGGEMEHTLTIAEMPTHNHAFPEFGWKLSRTDLNSGIQAIVRDDVVRFTANQGAGLPHNNLPPYLVVSYIIKG